MTDPYDPDLDAVDRAARAASRGLHDHVERHVNPEVALAALPPVEPPRRHGRWLAAAAVAALFVGSVAVLGNGPRDDDRSRLEVDEDGNLRPAPQPGLLTPLGPHDGRDSIQLPVTAEPNTGLRDGDKITVSGPGFVAGERVGIVMCASEAGDDNGATSEARAGIDACNTGGVQYADANEDGVATGTFTVKRVLSTPATGTVDCAAEANRCIIAMGALNDYDRSGGFGLAFAPGGEPIDIPSVTVSPAEGLSDGDLVHVEGAGFAPNQLVTLSVCSIDPSGCWQTGEEIHISSEQARELGLTEEYGLGGFLHLGLVSDGGGMIEGDVPVWRFLPTTDPGTYIDCAVSACKLRVSAQAGASPAPAALAFAPAGPLPRPPAVAVDPTKDLESGDELVVRGAGFDPGAQFNISLCASSAGDLANSIGCIGTGDGSARIDGDGKFAQLFEVPDPDQFNGMMTATTACSAEGSCTSPTFDGEGGFCDGVEIVCTIRVDAYSEGGLLGPPQFPPAPIKVTFRE